MSTIDHTAMTLQLKEILATAERCLEAGQLDAAASLCESALEMVSQRSELVNVEAPGILIGIGLVLKRAGRLKDAHQVCVLAIEIAEETLGTDHAQLAIFYHNLAELELVRGRFVAGESYARRSVEILQIELGPDHLDVAKELGLLAALLEKQGRYSESRLLYLRILPLFDLKLGLADELSMECQERLRGVEELLASKGVEPQGNETC